MGIACSVIPFVITGDKFTFARMEPVPVKSANDVARVAMRRNYCRKKTQKPQKTVVASSLPPSRLRGALARREGGWLD